MANSNDTGHVVPGEADPARDLISDLVALAETPRYRPGPMCSIATILRQLHQASEAAHDTLVAVVDNDTISASAVADLLSRHGYTVAAQTIARHRRRGQHNGCRCER